MKTFEQLINTQFLLGAETHYGTITCKKVLAGEVLNVTFDIGLGMEESYDFEAYGGNLVEL